MSFSNSSVSTSLPGENTSSLPFNLTKKSPLYRIQSKYGLIYFKLSNFF